MMGALFLTAFSPAAHARQRAHRFVQLRLVLLNALHDGFFLALIGRFLSAVGANELAQYG